MTKLEIVNLALRHLGMNKILALDESTPSAIVMDDFWDMCQDSVFEDHNWSFAQVQESLVESSTTVPFGWIFAYDHPTTNCAAVWAVFNEGTYNEKDSQDFDTYYMTENAARVLVTDLEDAIVEYTYKITDTTSWSAQFCRAMSYLLAASACHLLTGDAEKGMKLMQIYSAMIGEVKRLDASKQTKKAKFTSKYVNSRG